jgi:hypothetical protein
MTYNEIITKIRADVGDFPIRRYETANGDGATSLFQLAHPKVYEDSYVIKVDGTPQVENTDFTIDKDIGQVLFLTDHIPTGGDDNVSFEYQSVNMLDADWIDIINQVLSHWRRKIWIELTDETSLVTVRNQVDYDVATVATDVLTILNLEYRPTSSSPWRDIKADTNVVFYKDLQKIHIRPAFTISDNEIRIRALRAYVQGTATGSTFEPQDRYQPAIRTMAAALYFERQAAKMLETTAAVSKEKSFESAEVMFKLARQKKESAEVMLKQVRASKPSVTIPNAIAGTNI